MERGECARNAENARFIDGLFASRNSVYRPASAKNNHCGKRLLDLAADLAFRSSQIAVDQTAILGVEPAFCRAPPAPGWNEGVGEHVRIRFQPGPLKAGA